MLARLSATRVRTVLRKARRTFLRHKFAKEFATARAAMGTNLSPEEEAKLEERPEKNNFGASEQFLGQLTRKSLEKAREPKDNSKVPIED